MRRAVVAARTPAGSGRWNELAGRGSRMRVDRAALAISLPVRYSAALRAARAATNEGRKPRKILPSSCEAFRNR